MHFQSGDAHEKAWAAELFSLRMIAQHVADILAEKAFNAFPEFLDAIDFALIHFPFSVDRRRKRRNLFVDAVIPGDVGDQVLKHWKGFHRLHSDRFIQWQGIETRFAS